MPLNYPNVSRYYVTQSNECPTCAGSGEITLGAFIGTCPACKGSGEIVKQVALIEALADLGLLEKYDPSAQEAPEE